MGKHYYVRCVETRENFGSLKAACEMTGTDNKTLRNAMAKPHLKANGFHWEKIKIEPKPKEKKQRGESKKIAPTFMGIYPTEESGYINYGDFYHDKYRLFVKTNFNGFYKVKVCLNPPTKDRKANFYLDLKDVSNGVEIRKSKTRKILEEKYKYVYKSLLKYMEEVIS